MGSSKFNFFGKGNKVIGDKVKSCGKCFIIILMLSALSGCQLLSDPANDNVLFSHYYLWIKTLTEDEIIQEITRQKKNKQLSYIKADMQLIMLYSLPNSPVYNPYTAKAQLNNYQLEPYNGSIFNVTDLAFIIMLKDQLNQQLLLLEQVSNYKVMTASQQGKITQLSKQIIQLKKIEKTISERGQ